ncbi:hypothetical protein B5M47_02085 [candidate division CPR3 bacterium 4484_211]|uniref:Uncharacterized protein n=1 Tax=candidate division CPR3 bacterium 4484_211 TaxID=1968527 RepID=A0A1W9NYG9_UNCC3|nr:MAG: hypothetical protein B5M47_02085 [candidate division CPR3 bacterium 4484_211]
MGVGGDRLLLIDIGSAVSKAYLLVSTGAFFQLSRRAEMLTLDSAAEVVGRFRREMGEEAGRSKVVVSVSPAASPSGLEGFKLEGQVFRALLDRMGGDMGNGRGMLIFEVGAGKSWKGELLGDLKELEELNYGVGQGARRLLDSSCESNLARWLSEQMEFVQIGDYIGNKSIFPGQLPLSSRSLEIEEALCREILSELGKKVKSDWQKYERIYLSGAVLSQAPDVSHSLLIFLDAIPFEGVVDVWLDRLGILPVLGDLSVELGRFLTPLGSAVCFSHQLKEGEVVARIFLDLGLSEELSVVARSGDLIRVPVASERSVSMRLELPSGVELMGWDPDRQLSGGEVGVVIDARGRPFNKPEADELGRRKVCLWREAFR